MREDAISDGMLIAYATRDGEVAQDGEGGNSPYAVALANNLRNTAQPVLVALDNVASSVRQATNGAQKPTRYGDLPATVYLVPQGPANANLSSPHEVASVVPTLTVQPSRTFAASDDPDTALWKAVDRSASADDYEVYLKQYPKGKYATLAKSRLKKLKDDAAQQAKAAEQSAWQAAESAQTQERYAAYLARYPNGRYAALAQARVEKLKQDVAAQQEASLWQAAEQGEKPEIEAYVASYPRGRYASLASVRLKAFKAEEQRIAKAKQAAERQRQEREVADRAVASAREPAFRDAKTGLEWTQSDNGSDINWNEATNYCDGKGGGWRLPSPAELQGIYDASQSVSCGRYICHASTKFRLTGYWFWSVQSGQSGSWHWAIYLGDGAGLARGGDTRDGLRALCVRQPSLTASLIYAVDAEDAKALARRNNCFKCHAVEKDKDGPALNKVAEKYKGQPDAEERLIKYITSGEKAKFPDGHEEGHKIVQTTPPNDMALIENLVRWILSQ
jgi:cytochrome c